MACWKDCSLHKGHNLEKIIYFQNRNQVDRATGTFACQQNNFGLIYELLISHLLIMINSN